VTRPPQGRGRGRRKQRRPPFGAAVRTALSAVLRLGLVVAAVGITAVTSLRWMDPVTSSLIVQNNLAARMQSAGTDAPPWVSFTWRPLAQISPHMAAAVIAAEDQRFAHHHGLDFVELSKVLRAASSRPRGASTITQQVAKNLFLWGGRSYLRKALEAALAVYIDRVWGKRRVLEIYLNIAQFGAAIYGVENASWRFFGKRAADLNRFEAARLAAVLPNPAHRSATNASATVLQRQRWILGQMKTLGEMRWVDRLR